MPHHSAGQIAVGGDQRGAALWYLKRFTQQDRNRLRFLAGMRAGHQPHPRQAPRCGGQIDPARAGGWRQEQVGDRAAAGGRRCAKPGAVPRIDLSAGHSHPIEQQLEVILRVRCSVLRAERCFVCAGRNPRRTERGPYRFVQRQIQIGQDHRRRGQRSDHPQQLGKRGRGAGNSGGHHRVRRRRFLPALRRMIEQQITPDRSINLAARRQLAQPLRLHCGVKPGRIAPVPGQIADDPGDALLQQIAQFNPLDRQPVHGAPGFKRQPQQPGRLGSAVTHLGPEQFG